MYIYINVRISYFMKQLTHRLIDCVTVLRFITNIATYILHCIIVYLEWSLNTCLLYFLFYFLLYNFIYVFISFSCFNSCYISIFTLSISPRGLIKYSEAESEIAVHSNTTGPNSKRLHAQWTVDLKKTTEGWQFVSQMSKCYFILISSCVFFTSPARPSAIR